MRTSILATAGAGTLTLAAAVSLRRRYHGDLALAHRRLVRSGVRVAQTECGPIQYAVYGDGVPVLEVHGIFGGFDQGLAAARPILGDGYRIIAPSRFGYLGTPLPRDASPANQADAYACLLDHLALRRVVVMAHSAGSVSAIHLALRHPERVAAMVLVVPAAPGPGPSAPPRRVVEALFRTDAACWLLATYLPSILPLGVPAGWDLTEQDRAEICRILQTMLPATSRRDGFLFDMFVSTPTINAGIPFGGISVPVLVVTASDDPLASPHNARRLASLIPHARLLEIESGGHLLLGHAATVRADVRAFLEQTSAPLHRKEARVS
jgi:2-hydroxy-6-oxonona-2,4-dienedioate hydrolase